jgi:hypothetical protein
MTRWRGRFKSLRLRVRGEIQLLAPLCKERSVSFPSPMESLATAVKSAEGAKNDVRGRYRARREWIRVR